MTNLEFSSTSYTVNRGTFTSGLCMSPAGSNIKFSNDISFEIEGTTFSTSPSTLSAN